VSTPPPGARGPELRIGDSEREAAVTALGEHYAAGRLTKEEFDERADAAWAARSSSALWPLFADLPGPARPAAQQPVAPRRPSPGPRIGVRILPLLVLVLVLGWLTHLPVFLLLVVWLVWARLHHSSHGAGHWAGSRRQRFR
jgi:Domain of unknown function (DUF1707)